MNKFTGYKYNRTNVDFEYLMKTVSLNNTDHFIGGSFAWGTPNKDSDIDLYIYIM